MRGETVNLGLLESFCNLTSRAAGLDLVSMKSYTLRIAMPLTSDDPCDPFLH